MYDEITKEVAKYLVLFVIAIFLPKKINYVIRSFFTYIYANIRKKWKKHVSLSLVLISITTIIQLFSKGTFLGLQEYICLIIISCILIITNSIYSLKISKSKSHFTIYPSYTIKDDEFIVNDIQSESINKLIQNTIFFFEKRFYVYRNGYLTVKFEPLPDFFSIFLSYNGLLKFIKKRLNQENPISIHFQKDVLNNEINPQFFFLEDFFSNTFYYEYLNEVSKSISRSKNLEIEQKINFILHIYFLISSNTLFDNMLRGKDYHAAFSTLNDFKTETEDLKNKAKSIGYENDSFNNFISFCESVSKRFYAYIYFKQDEFYQSIDLIFESNQINPYYPFSNLAEAKKYYINNYLVNLIPQILENMEINNEAKAVSLARTYLDSLQKTESNDLTTNQDLIIEIIKSNLDKPEILNYIEKKLTDYQDNNTFNLLFQSEIYKFLPRGLAIINNLYVDRIPLIIELLEKIIISDPEFDFIHTKIATLKFLQNTSSEETDLTEAINYFDKYKYIYTKYGIIM